MVIDHMFETSMVSEEKTEPISPSEMDSRINWDPHQLATRFAQPKASPIPCLSLSYWPTRKSRSRLSAMFELPSILQGWQLACPWKLTSTLANNQWRLLLMRQAAGVCDVDFR